LDMTDDVMCCRAGHDTLANHAPISPLLPLAEETKRK